MAKKRKNFIREKRIYCGEEYLEVDIVAVTNMPEAGKGKKGKSSQAQKNLNDKRSKRRFVQIANTNFGTNDFHISATYNNEHLPMSLEEAEKNVHNYLDRIKRKMKRETGEDLKYMLVTEYTPEEEEGQLSGDKQEEYREIKPYYTTRFKKIFEMYPNSNIPTGLDKQLIGFRNGYGSSRPQFTAVCSLDIKTGKEEWGAEPGTEYYTLHIHEIRERKDC